jgi:hypothetical protein
MTRRSGSSRVTKTPSVKLCAAFSGTSLASSARPGLEVLEREHKTIVIAQTTIKCGLALDRIRQAQEPTAHRWDYVFSIDDMVALGVEVHHTASDQVDVMIAKRDWAVALLSRECSSLTVSAWFWVAPPDSEIYLLVQEPNAKRLADAGIEFPIRICRFD